MKTKNKSTKTKPNITEPSALAKFAKDYHDNHCDGWSFATSDAIGNLSLEEMQLLQKELKSSKAQTNPEINRIFYKVKEYFIRECLESLNYLIPETVQEELNKSKHHRAQTIWSSLTTEAIKKLSVSDRELLKEYRYIS